MNTLRTLSNYFRIVSRVTKYGRVGQLVLSRLDIKDSLILIDLKENIRTLRLD